MKRFNFNIKDRKVLTLGLCLVVVCVFTLTIAYAALNAVLTISGNASVVASNWDIYLENPRVISESATTDVPTIVGNNTLKFNTTLNMPGDFYEFTVDVVNDGSIDAMIENVIKTPELTDEQAKYLKYEVNYKNGESITTKQTLYKNTTMPIKVRVEYRRDINASDLPTSQTKLDLALTLEYVQSDNTGSVVLNNGIVKPIADGNIEDIGTIVTIGTEQFYTLGCYDNNVKMLSMYNLYVGGYFETVGARVWVPYGSESSGMQDSTMLGAAGKHLARGVTPFSTEEKKGVNNTSYDGSLVKSYVDNYKSKLEEYFEVNIVEARLITKEELLDPNIGCVLYSCVESSYPWIYATSYWTGTASSTSNLWRVSVANAGLNISTYNNVTNFGVRPVIVISKDYFN